MRVVRAAAGRRGESVNEEGDDADDGEAPRRRRVLRGGAEDVRALAGVVQLRLLRAAGRVMAWDPAFGGPHGRAMKRAMAPGEFSRAEKEMVAAVVSGVNACVY